jgi:plastocyanin
MRTQALAVSCVALLSFFAWGCGSEEPSPPGAAPAEDAAATTAGADEDEEQASAGSTPGETSSRRSGSSRSAGVETLPSEPYESEILGSIRGEVRFAGEAPERFKIVAEEKAECTQHADVDHLSELVIVNDGKLQNVLVHVTRGFDASAVPAPPAEPAHLDQRGCTYVPHVLAVQAGRTILVGNSDPTNHNVNIVARKNDISDNRNVGAGQAPLSVVPDKEELSILFKCDIHPWMRSWLHVIEHPWFAVSDPQGAFEIRDLPPGKYSLEFVHEEYGKKTARDVVVEAGKSTVRAATFP